MAKKKPALNRRAADREPVWKARSFALALLMGLAGFTYQMQDILRQHTEHSWEWYGSPAGFGEVLFALFCGLSAILAALGLNVQRLLRSFQKER